MLQQSHKIHPEAPEPAFDLARAYIAEGKLKDAQSALQDVMKVNPSYPGALILLAALNLQGGRVDQAIQNLNEDRDARAGFRRALFPAFASVRCEGRLPFR